MLQTSLKIGPDDHGRRMQLHDFEHAEVSEGHQYELSRGVITVSDVPALRHGRQVRALKKQVEAYDELNPGQIDYVASGSECKLLIVGFESERHPDLAIYKYPPESEEDPWPTWVPDVVIEVVSATSIERDYVEKREEYLRLGVREYWIIDAAKNQMLVLKRMRGEWTEKAVRPPKKYETRLLPGFVVDLRTVFGSKKR